MIENKNLGEIFNPSGKNQSRLNILLDFYFTELTHKEIAKKNGLSVSRIHMLRNGGRNRLMRYWEYWEEIFTDIEEEFRLLWEPFDPNITLEIASDKCQSILLDKDWGVDKSTSYLPVLAMRLLVDNGSSVYQRYPCFSLAACSIKPYIEKHPEVLRKLGKVEEWSYSKIIEYVLEQHGRPMDRKELLLKAKGLNKRNTFNLTSFNAAITDMKHLVARTVDGKYCIVYWGIPCEDPYVELIINVFNVTKKPLTLLELEQELRNTKGLTIERLLLYLSRHPMFYQTILGVERGRYSSTYGLRAWLFENTKPKSRTPKWLTESSESVKRVEEYEARDYNIKDLVLKDQ